MERADDALILERARDAESVCITLDHDFHAYLAFAGQGRPSVVLPRVQGRQPWVLTYLMISA